MRKFLFRRLMSSALAILFFVTFLPSARGTTVTGTVTVSGGEHRSSSDSLYIVGGFVDIRDAGSKWSISGGIGIGEHSGGTLSITNGGAATCVGVSVADSGTDSSGLAIVSGSGSTWTVNGSTLIGTEGSGTLSITKGGTINCAKSYYDAGVGVNGPGRATVDGAGSIWDIGAGLSLGGAASGTLSIANGAVVNSGRYVMGLLGAGITIYKGSIVAVGRGSQLNACGNYECPGWLDVYSGTLSVSGGSVTTYSNSTVRGSSLLTMDVGLGSKLHVGSGTLTNNGTVRLNVGSGAGTGTYEPIQAWMVNGSATCQAVGGVWNPGNYTVAVSTAGTGTSGSMLTIDRSATQRILVTDAGSGGTLGASFLGATTSSTLSVVATAIAGGVLDALKTASQQSVLSAWTLSTDGYTVSGTTPAYLSLAVGAGQLLDNLTLWHYDGSNWTQFVACDLNYDDTYASFTVTGLSGYAVTTAVPEPGTLVLLVAGAIGLAAYGWRRRR
jgi:T5SS/PEP-CTERM-associated repeat protein